jgi:EpsI family protein
MYKYLITVIILISAITVSNIFSKPEKELDRRSLSEFPKVIGEWKVIDEETIGESSMAVLLVDDYIMRTYVNSEGDNVGLYIGYFKNQREGKQVHSPRQCLPGAGWEILESRKYILALEKHNPPEVPINFYLMGKGDARQLYLWWYQGRGRIINNEYINKLFLIWDAMTKQRTDGSLVRINMAISSNSKTSLNKEVEFINSFVQFLPLYIPD